MNEISEKNSRKRKLHKSVEFSLFATSYLPLFLLLIVRQISQNNKYLSWAGINWESVLILIQKFGLSILLIAISLFGLLGLIQSIKNISQEARINGHPIVIKDVKNRNAEAISYIGTYIIPFLFQDYSDWYSLISILFLLFVIYKIYINSTLMLINPILNINYSLYEIEFYDTKDHSKYKSGLMITKDKFLQEDDSHLIHNIGPKLYFGVLNEENRKTTTI
jgi:hypothetical protein